MQHQSQIGRFQREPKIVRFQREPKFTQCVWQMKRERHITTPEVEKHKARRLDGSRTKKDQMRPKSFKLLFRDWHDGVLNKVCKR